MLFISLTIDFSSFASFSSSLLRGYCACPVRNGETTVRVEFCDDVGDADLGGGLAVGAAAVAFDAAVVDRLDVFDFRLGYFVECLIRALPRVGRFQYVWSPKSLSSSLSFPCDMFAC